ncbi:uncharacterized protein LOC129602260 isoform X2 [Paramacrobiotus metropolitanus]|uniref:uncharacterized protein LOC129602260 isoform X2 n=1 Tax=Paramacrobiotus metropolitanus TaxID=2943436 RepID=UPI002446172E|nr:uncharacterized protein LOC129602260 isoform X2 [Paramacrobiotus metropolitanus]
MMTIPPEDITSRLADVEFDAPEQFEIPEPSGIYTANKTLQTSYEDDDGRESPLPSFTTFFQRQYQRDNSLSPVNSRTFVEYSSPSSNDTLSSLDTTVSEPRSGDSDEVIPRNTRNVLLDLEKSLVQESVQEDSGPLSLASLLKSVRGLGVTVTENGSGPVPSQSSLAVDAGRSSPSVQNEAQLQSGPSFVRRRTFVDLPTPVSSNDSFTSLETTLVEPNQELSEDEEKPEDSEFLKFFRLQIARAFLLCDVVRRDPARYFLTITGQRSVLVLFLHIPLAVPTTADALRLIHWDLQKLTGRIR